MTTEVQSGSMDCVEYTIISPEITPYQRLIETASGLTQDNLPILKLAQLQHAVDHAFLSPTFVGRDVDVLRSKFGLDGDGPKTLRRVAQALGYNNQARVRTILWRGIYNLRREEFGLRDYTTLSPDSVASRIGGIHLTWADMRFIPDIPMEELGTVAPTVEFISWQTGIEWDNVNTLLRDNAKPFLGTLSDKQLLDFQGSIRRAYGRARNSRFLPELASAAI